MSASNEPVACSLPAPIAARQAGEWERLHAHVRWRERRADGVVMVVDTGGDEERAHEVVDLAAREAACCSFLTIRVVRGDGEVRVEMASEHPEAGPVIDLLTGWTGR